MRYIKAKNWIYIYIIIDRFKDLIKKKIDLRNSKLTSLDPFERSHLDINKIIKKKVRKLRKNISNNTGGNMMLEKHPKGESKHHKQISTRPNINER